MSRKPVRNIEKPGIYVHMATKGYRPWTARKVADVDIEVGSISTEPSGAVAARLIIQTYEDGDSVRTVIADTEEGRVTPEDLYRTIADDALAIAAVTAFVHDRAAARAQAE